MEQKRPPNSLDCRRTVKVVRIALSSSSFIASLALFFKKKVVLWFRRMLPQPQKDITATCEKWPRPLDESFGWQRKVKWSVCARDDMEYSLHSGGRGRTLSLGWNYGIASDTSRNGVNIDQVIVLRSNIECDSQRTKRQKAKGQKDKRKKDKKKQKAKEDRHKKVVTWSMKGHREMSLSEI